MKSFVFDTNLSVNVSLDPTAQTNKHQDDLAHNNKLLIESQINTLPGDLHYCKEQEISTRCSRLFYFQPDVKVGQMEVESIK